MVGFDLFCVGGMGWGRVRWGESSGAECDEVKVAGRGGVRWGGVGWEEAIYACNDMMHYIMQVAVTT